MKTSAVEFSSKPNQSHLNHLIKVLLGKLEYSRQVGWGKLVLNSVELCPQRPSLDTPVLKGLLSVEHGCPILLLEGQHPVEFSSKFSSHFSGGV